MRRRNLLARTAGLVALPAAIAGVATGTGLVSPALAAEDRYRYRGRRGRHRTGLLLKDVEGSASWGRRYGDFEGDVLVQQLHYGRVLHVSGRIEGQADLEGRRRDFEVDIDNERFRRAEAVLSERRGRVSLDIGEIELGRLEIDLDAVRVHRIFGPHGDRLERLLRDLAEALADEGGYRKARGGDRDIDELIGAIDLLLSRHLFVVDRDRYRA